MSQDFKPYVPASQKPREFTFTAVAMGAVLGIIFGASSLYLALKVGMTVTAAIPISVLSVTLFRYLSKNCGTRQTTILENNIVQTTGSAGESLAFGLAVTVPALLILGYDMEMSHIMVSALLGGLLGVVMMVPMRRAFIVRTHGELPFPEGIACANILIAGEEGGANARQVTTGFLAGLVYKTLYAALRLWKEIPDKAFGFLKGGMVSLEVSPELLGVGYIIGTRSSCIVVAGGILSSWLLIPAIKMFGDGRTTPLFPATKLISEMAPHEIWRNYVLYIGAGAVAMGGLISLVENLPTIVRAAKQGIQGLGLGKGGSKGTTGGKPERTDDDIPMSFVVVAVAILVAAITLSPSFHMNVVGAVLIVFFGFLFITVASRISGEIGMSSNPLSGMTVATLLITSLIFLAMGWTHPEDRVTALMIAAVVCMAACCGGQTTQDLKTGMLVGATPRYQQIGMLVGVLTSSLVIGYTLQLLNNASTVYSKLNLPHVQISDPALLTGKTEQVHDFSHNDSENYQVLQVRETPSSGPLSALLPGKYLVDRTGVVQYLVDPGINGRLSQRDNGTHVTKYEAPKARLMSMIIDGILSQKLPWSLVLLGAAISIVVQLCGVSALPFATGVYLPLSTSTPIFVGGLVRWIVAKRFRKKKTTEADSDSGSGVLFSSGLIAGGAITGIVVAGTSVSSWGAKLDLSHHFPKLSESDLVAILTFIGLCILVYLAGASDFKKKGRTP